MAVHPTRRCFLLLLGASTTIGLAGCPDDGLSDGEESPTETRSSDAADDSDVTDLLLIRTAEQHTLASSVLEAYRAVTIQDGGVLRLEPDAALQLHPQRGQ